MDQCGKIFNDPNVIRYTRFHRWRDAQWTMNLGKVVLYEVERRGKSGHHRIPISLDLNAIIAYTVRQRAKAAGRARDLSAFAAAARKKE